MKDTGMPLIPPDSHKDEYRANESSSPNCFVLNAQGRIADLFLLFQLLKPTSAANRLITMQKNMKVPPPHTGEKCIVLRI